MVWCPLNKDIIKYAIKYVSVLNSAIKVAATGDKTSIDVVVGKKIR